MDQWVKNLPAVPEMQETRVPPLGWEDPLEEGRYGNPLQYSCLENPVDRGALQVLGCLNAEVSLMDGFISPLVQYSQADR